MKDTMTHVPELPPQPDWAGARTALLELAPPAHIEAALLRACARRKRSWRVDLSSWISIAALGGIAAMLVIGVHQRPTVPPSPAMAQYGSQYDFVPLAAMNEAHLFATPAQLLHATLPRSTLVAMGIPIADNAPDELIRAELLVAASGEALAVRLSLN